MNLETKNRKASGHFFIRNHNPVPSIKGFNITIFKRIIILGFIFVFLFINLLSESGHFQYSPDITEMISKDYLSSDEPVISPNGKKIIYFIRKVNWDKNSFEENCYLYNEKTRSTRILNKDIINSNVRWLDNKYAGYIREGQIHIYDTVRKKPKKVFSVNGEIKAFEPFGNNGIVYLVDMKRGVNSDLKYNFYGNIEHVEEDEEKAAICYIPNFRKSYALKIFDPVTEDLIPLPSGLTIKSFTTSAESNSVYMNCIPGNSHIYWKKNLVIRIFINLGPSKKFQRTISRIPIPPHSEIVCTSPDGTSGLIRSWGKNPKIYNRDRLHIIDLSDKSEYTLSEDLLSDLDRQPISIHWNPSGLFFSYWNGTKIGLAEIRDRKILPVLTNEKIFPRLRFSVSDNGDLSFAGGNRKNCFNIFLAKSDRSGNYAPLKKITKMDTVSKQWDWGTSELIKWESSDGILLEGILRKPSNFDPKRKYPLIFLIHGGPMWADLEFREDKTELYYYPVLQFLKEDILIFKPNYRGSRGYGEIFTSAKTGMNMGLFSLWDLEGAISFLSKKGFIDRNRIGCMGWSHGGYISAFVATNSEMFRAVSVGGGTSDFGIYASNNEISCEVTRDFLGENPLNRNTKLYKATSPCGNITPFTIPTLIQHGEFDQVSPLHNAKELYRGLKENGVPVEFFIFNRMGHGISTPKESRALLTQNFIWFTHYLKGEKLDFLRLNRL